MRGGGPWALGTPAPLGGVGLGAPRCHPASGATACSVLALIPFPFLEGKRAWLAEPLGPCQEVEAYRPATAAPPASDTQSLGPREGWA